MVVVEVNGAIIAHSQKQADPGLGPACFWVLGVFLFLAQAKIHCKRQTSPRLASALAICANTTV